MDVIGLGDLLACALTGVIMRHLDLFSGIGGFALAARWAGIETVGFCEIEDFPRKVLAKNFPGVKIHEDIKDLNGEEYRNIDLITGGFPCQPFSTASRGRKTAKDWWPEMFRVVRESRPRFVLGENVQKKPIERAARQLESIGYGAFTICQSAHRKGSWHRRNRWFFVAHPNDEGEFQSRFNAEMALLQGLENSLWQWPDIAGAIRVFNGIPHRVDRLKSLGNAIVPQVAYEIMKAIKLAS